MEWWLSRAGGRKNGESLFNGDKVLVWQDERVLQMDDGDGWTAMCH